MRKAILVLEVNGYPCEECSVVAAQGPWDDDASAPELPIHPNCRCDWVPDFPDVPNPDSVPTEDQRDASVAVDDENLEEALRVSEGGVGSGIRGHHTDPDDNEKDGVGGDGHVNDTPLANTPEEGLERLSAKPKSFSTKLGSVKKTIYWDTMIEEHFDSKPQAERDKRLCMAPRMVATVQHPSNFFAVEHDGEPTMYLAGRFKSGDDAEIVMVPVSKQSDGRLRVKTWYTVSEAKFAQQKGMAREDFLSTLLGD